MTYFICLLLLPVGSPVVAQAAAIIKQTEVATAEFAQFVAVTGYFTKTELTGGMVNDSGRVTKPD